MTSVLIADDQTLIRQAVADILADYPGITVIGQAVNGLEAVNLAGTLHPDIVLMDIRMPKMDGIEATHVICSDPDLAGTRVLILTTFEEDAFVVAALRAGASGFIGKGAEPDDIANAVQAVHEGDALLSPAATRALIESYIKSPSAAVGAGVSVDAQTQLTQLTDREREVLLLVAKGKSNQDIATTLFISTHTAKTHVNRIMTKLDAHDRAQLVIAAYEGGLLVPGAN